MLRVHSATSSSGYEESPESGVERSEKKFTSFSTEVDPQLRDRGGHLYGDRRLDARDILHSPFYRSAGELLRVTAPPSDFHCAYCVAINSKESGRTTTVLLSLGFSHKAFDVGNAAVTSRWQYCLSIDRPGIELQIFRSGWKCREPTRPNADVMKVQLIEYRVKHFD